MLRHRENHDISHQRAGYDLTPEELAQWLIQLQNLGMNSLVTFIHDIYNTY